MTSSGVLTWSLPTLPGSGAVDPDGPSGAAPFLLAQADRARVTNLRADLDVDTDRDGIVDGDKDERAEQNWTNERGAIYNVNLDSDGGRVNAAGIPVPDAVNFDDAGNPTDEDYKIENAEDAKDLAPMIIRKIGNALPAGFTVWLVPASRDDLRHVHVFKSLTPGAGNLSIMGNATRPFGLPIALDITSWVNPNSPTFQGDQATKDTSFGIEGMFFRYLGPDVVRQLAFDGIIQFTLRITNQNFRIIDGGQDIVRLKVAPWMMISPDEPSEQVWAFDGGAANAAFIRSPAPGYGSLNDSGQLHTIADRTKAPTDWLQDHVEFGYTQRPGGPAMHMVFRLPYSRPDNPIWPLTDLLAPNVGVFQLGQRLIPPDSFISGDFGGNLEVLPHAAGYPRGRIVVGNTASEELKNFLISQEVQAPLVVDANWLKIGHIDEYLSFLDDGRVVIADPKMAWDLLEAIPAADRGKSVFFTKKVFGN